MLQNWNFWISVITAAAAVIALFLTVQQIRTSNKQHLFDRRLNNYIIATGLISLYKEHKTFLEKERKDGPQFTMESEFEWLTNNTYLEQQIEAIRHPLEQPYHKDFLKKRQDLSELATEIQLVFTGSVSSVYSNFVSSYELTLFKMYQYQIIINKIQKSNETNPRRIEELQKLYPEKERRHELYAAMEKLKMAYAEIVDTGAEQKIQKQMILR